MLRRRARPPARLTAGTAPPLPTSDEAAPTCTTGSNGRPSSAMSAAAGALRRLAQQAGRSISTSAPKLGGHGGNEPVRGAPPGSLRAQVQRERWSRRGARDAARLHAAGAYQLHVRGWRRARCLARAPRPRLPRRLACNPKRSALTRPAAAHGALAALPARAQHVRDPEGAARAWRAPAPLVLTLACTVCADVWPFLQVWNGHSVDHPRRHGRAHRGGGVPAEEGPRINT